MKIRYIITWRMGEREFKETRANPREVGHKQMKTLGKHSATCIVIKCERIEIEA